MPLSYAADLQLYEPEPFSLRFIPHCTENFLLMQGLRIEGNRAYVQRPQDTGYLTCPETSASEEITLKAQLREVFP